MSIYVACDCGKEFNVRDELAGRKVRCPSCQAVLEVPAADEDVAAGPPPRSGQRPAFRDDDEDEAPPRRRRRKRDQPKSNAMLFALLGGGALLLSCCCLGLGAGGYFLFFADKSKGSPGGGAPTPPMEERVKLSLNELRDNPVPESGLGKVPFKTYKVSLKAGKTYQIDLINPNFNPNAGPKNLKDLHTVLDPFLIVEDKAGKRLADDDDGGGYPHSRLFFTPPSDGEYRIICTVLFPNLSGELILKVVEKK
jgi:hypothetical protein